MRLFGFSTHKSDIPGAVEIFDAAAHTQKWPKTTEDLDGVVAAYDPQGQFEAGLNFDHKQDGPAGGWIERVWREGTKLFAKLAKVQDWFRDRVLSGEYPRRSAEFLIPSNKYPKGYLKAVAFLGNAVPACKGMAPVDAAAFSAMPEGIVFFTTAEDGSAMTGKPYAIDPKTCVGCGSCAKHCERGAIKAMCDDLDKDKQSNKTEENKMTPEEIKALQDKAALADGEIARLQEVVKGKDAEIAKFQEAEAERTKTDRKKALEDHAAELVKAGKISPASAKAYVAFCEKQNLDADGADQLSVLFADSKAIVLGADGKAKTDPPDAKAVDKSENQDRAVHEKAVAYQEKHPGVSYSAAISAVSRGAA